MKELKPIRTEDDYDAAIEEIEALWGAAEGTRKGDRLEVLMMLVERFEEEHHRVEPPDPIEAIKLRMADKGLDRQGLGELLGVGSGRVAEILNRDRRLTLSMVRKLAVALDLSERCLVQDYPLRRPPKAAA